MDAVLKATASSASQGGEQLFLTCRDAMAMPRGYDTAVLAICGDIGTSEAESPKGPNLVVVLGCSPSCSAPGNPNTRIRWLADGARQGNAPYCLTPERSS